MTDSATQPPIAHYAITGCTRSAALISREGSIDWLAWPRFDAPSIFARILDWQRGGHFSIAPAASYRVSRRYIDDTNVLATTFETAGGTLVLTDLMPVMSEEAKQTRLTPFRRLLRRVECTRGEVPVEVVYAPRPDYVRVTPKLQQRGDCVYCEWRARVLNLRSDAEFVLDGGTATARFTLRDGELRMFGLSYDDHAPAVMPLLQTTEIDETIDYWRRWSSRLSYDGPYRDLVMRSALVLKLLTYAPSGAIVAAPTTSLPEAIGGIRNWDYRYCWLRDASFTVAALYDCGFEREGAAFVDWLIYSTRLTQPRLQVLYDVFGESHVPEQELSHLDGYHGSKPVRTGNNASSQFQLDVYGELLSALDEAVQRGETIDRDIRRVIRRIASQVMKRWREPDAGIWEKRGGNHQHVHGKVMAWLALDCAERLGCDLAGLRQAKDAIHAEVLARGFNVQRNTFTDIYGSEEVDAALLYIARVHFIDPADPRMLGTIDAIRADLGHDGLLHRYDTARVEDGLPPGEGAFLACSFWLAEALALAGKRDEARRVFEDAAAHGNDVGLFSEEIDIESGALIGNFPQALTHTGLMNAALALLQRGE
jgi:GH15 family glucan-1,4-alpha-glucosidase